MRAVALSAIAIFVAGCGAEEPAVVDVSSYNIDASRITVSGASSGAMMATQMHVAHSGFVHGAALLAGGPYYCSEASLSKGLDACMKGGDLNLPALVEYARAAETAGTIDALKNLADDPVWVFRGKNDVVIHSDLTRGTADFYREIGATESVVVDDVAALHGFPTLASGVPCDSFETPFINACDYDAAGEALGTLYGDLAPRGAADGALIEVPQPGAADATMLESALVYVPAACAAGEECGLHIAFHGCQQSTAYVGDAFATLTGYNEWAETNKLVVLYPQVDSSRIAPMNPMGCWDWWGYTDDNFATKDGPQMRVVKATLDLLAGKTL